MRNLDHCYQLAISTDDKVKEFVAAWNSSKEAKSSPFEILDYGRCWLSGFNPSYRYVYIGHKQKLPNTSVGLADYLTAIVRSIGYTDIVCKLNN